MRKVICGIDLGTTNSSIAYLNDGKPEAIPLEEGQVLVPSIVSLDAATHTIIVGRSARNRLAAFPAHTVRSIKRQMGQHTPVRLGAEQFSPEEISSFILKYLAFQASQVIGQKVHDVVITVPAYFNDAQRRATIRAGELAGLEVARIINEPTAAALAYDYISFQQETSSPYILVYDLGGGTFDVSILEVKGDIKEVLASCGDTALGGDDFDERLVDFFREQLSKQVQGEVVLDTAARVRLRDIAEKTKIALSDQPFYQVAEAAILSVAEKPLNLYLEVRRRDFEELVVDLVERTTEKVKDALGEAQLRPQDIGKILLVGGATRMPVVQDRLQGMFDRPIYHALDPDLCVALGAATQGGLISGEPLGHILLDVTAHSLGVRTIDEINPITGEPDYFSIIIRRNTRIPKRQAEVYATLSDAQSLVHIEVYQGEKASCLENVEVGSFDFLLKPSPAHSPIRIEFAYDKEGLIHITVDQKGYQNQKEVTLDIRQKKIIGQESDTPVGQVMNYIIEKARKLLAGGRLPRDLQDHLQGLTDAYEQALGGEGQDQDIDTLEDALLTAIEDAEEGLSRLG